MENQFQAGVNIALKIPKSKYEATVKFYREVLQLEVEEKPIDHPTVSKTHRVSFGAHVLWLDCVDHNTHAETWLQLTVSDMKDAIGYLESKGVNTCDEIEALPDNMHWIQDPAGTVFNIQERKR